MTTFPFKIVKRLGRGFYHVSFKKCKHIGHVHIMNLDILAKKGCTQCRVLRRPPAAARQPIVSGSPRRGRSEGQTAKMI